VHFVQPAANIDKDSSPNGIYRDPISTRLGEWMIVQNLGSGPIKVLADQMIG